MNSEPRKGSSSFPWRRTCDPQRAIFTRRDAPYTRCAVRFALVFMFGLVASCHRGPTPYRSAMDAAEEARRRGSFSEERRHFDEAARLAKKPKDESEARYRSAQSWVREGNAENGAKQLEQFARAYPTSARVARALLDAGRAWEDAGHREKALSAYRHLVTKYPESGNALSAAERIVALETESQKIPAHEVWRSLLKQNRSPEFDEALRYRYARSLEAISQKKALLAYEDVAKKHPLPQASYSDEALLRAAKLRRELKDPEGAIATLELLLVQGGKAAIVGSYTRATYIEALLLKGRILRDDLEEPEAALRVFESLPEKHPKSRLVDDALLECVRTERSLGRDPCPRLQVLRRLDPESRYLRCEAHLCSASTSDDRQARICEEWLSGAP